MQYSWNNEEYKDMPEKDIWVIKLCGYYTEKSLFKKYTPDIKTSEIKISDICHDLRRINTVRKHLESLNLIVPAPAWLKMGILNPVEEDIEKILSDYATKPKFNISGIKKEKEYSYSTEKESPVKCRLDCYKKIDTMLAGEIIYIYLHQDEYDFQKITKKMNKYSETALRVYPVNGIDTLEENILNAKLNKFAKENVQEILSKVSGSKIQALYNRYREYSFDEGEISGKHFTKEAYLPVAEYDSDSQFTLTDIQNRIALVKKQQRFLDRALYELLMLQKQAQDLGEEKFQETILETTRETITERAPIWAFDTENTSKRELALTLLKGTSIISDNKI